MFLRFILHSASQECVGQVINIKYVNYAYLLAILSKSGIGLLHIRHSLEGQSCFQRTVVWLKIFYCSCGNSALRLPSVTASRKGNANRWSTAVQSGHLLLMGENTRAATRGASGETLFIVLQTRSYTGESIVT